MLFVGLLICTLIIGLTVFIHAIALDFIIKHTEQLDRFVHKITPVFRRAFFLAFVVLGLMFAHTLEIWVWAGLYHHMEFFTGFEEALYFSTASFTTVGYGDIVLDPPWRILSVIESANGFILFGWSTAFVFEVMSRLYDKERLAIRLKRDSD